MKSTIISTVLLGSILFSLASGWNLLAIALCALSFSVVLGMDTDK